jgi:hypothetical protein
MPTKASHQMVSGLIRPEYFDASSEMATTPFTVSIVFLSNARIIRYFRIETKSLFLPYSNCRIPIAQFYRE